MALAFLIDRVGDFMAGDWIKVEASTPEKPEVYAVAEMLGIEPEHAFGCLCIIWIWADQQTIDGNAASVTKMLVDRKTGVKGFAEAMIKVGWLEQCDEGLRFVNFDRHNGQTAKKRAVTAKRVAKHKQEKRHSNESGNDKGNAKSVTAESESALPREEKRRDTPPHPHAGARERFPMSEAWEPNRDKLAAHIRMMNISGIAAQQITETIGEFRSYWITQDRKYSEDEWTQRFAKELKRVAVRSAGGNHAGSPRAGGNSPDFIEEDLDAIEEKYGGPIAH